MGKIFSGALFASSWFWASACFLVIAVLSGLFIGMTLSIDFNSGPAQFPNSWALLVPLAFAVFEVWLFRREWKRQNPPKKSKVKALNRAPQLILLQPEFPPRTKKRVPQEREKVLV
jgi:hypothetical protein